MQLLCMCIPVLEVHTIVFYGFILLLFVNMDIVHHLGLRCHIVTMATLVRLKCKDELVPPSPDPALTPPHPDSVPL